MGTTCYKIVTTGGTVGLRSLFIHGDYTVIYTPGVESVALIGGLLVFETLATVKEYARAFGWINGRDELWEAEGNDEVVLPPFRAAGGVPRHYPAIWGLPCTSMPMQMKWPTGTKAFKQVKLTRRIRYSMPDITRKAAE